MRPLSATASVASAHCGDTQNREWLTVTSQRGLVELALEDGLVDDVVCSTGISLVLTHLGSRNGGQGRTFDNQDMEVADIFHGLGRRGSRRHDGGHRAR